MLTARDAKADAARILKPLVQLRVALVTRKHLTKTGRRLLVPVMVARGNTWRLALVLARASVVAV